MKKKSIILLLFAGTAIFTAGAIAAGVAISSKERNTLEHLAEVQSEQAVYLNEYNNPIFFPAFVVTFTPFVNDPNATFNAEQLKTASNYQITPFPESTWAKLVALNDGYTATISSIKVNTNNTVQVVVSLQKDGERRDVQTFVKQAVPTAANRTEGAGASWRTDFNKAATS
ncbi:hypothetical protein ACA758_04740 [Mycoplasmopsis agassizii]|uniref:hypothetical protein n=1 Tax=Mycoplasmopsis agassizii TaxID=33922 RepID=UPI0035290031